MSRPIANVNPNHDSWSVLLERVNDMAYTFTNFAVTTFPNTAGAVTSGNGFVTGIFGSTTLVAGTALRGGTVASPGALNVISNTAFTGETVNVSSVTTLSGNTNISGALNITAPSVTGSSGTATTLNGVVNLRGAVAANGGVTVTGGALQVNSAATLSGATTVSGSLSITGVTTISANVSSSADVSVAGATNLATLNVSGNSVFTGTVVPSANNNALGETAKRWRLFASNVESLNVMSNLVAANNVSIANTVDTSVTANGNMGANTSAPQTIITIPRTSYRSGQMKFQIKSTVGYQYSEASFVHDDNDVYMSVYGTVASNNELADISAVVSGANLVFRIKQNVPNLDVRVVTTYMK